MLRNAQNRIHISCSTAAWGVMGGDASEASFPLDGLSVSLLDEVRDHPLSGGPLNPPNSDTRSIIF